jgi:hypothetical protein
MDASHPAFYFRRGSMFAKYFNSLPDIYAEICGFRTPHKSIATRVGAL